jgi:type I restriction enzyme M protein
MNKVATIPDGKILDYIDGKFRNDTQEEYVRQTIERRLVEEHRYPVSQIAVEFTLKNGSRRPRADIVIFGKDSGREQSAIKIIVECKQAKVNPSATKDGIEQLKSYMSICVNCEWGMWTNSVQRFVFHKVEDKATGERFFEEYNDIPSAEGNITEIDRPTRNNLKNAVDDNLLFVFRTCHDYIYANDGLHKDKAFFEFLKIIFCKIEDEKNFPRKLEFYATSLERKNPDGQLTVKNRIEKIFGRVELRYPQIFSDTDSLELTPRSLARVVSELQKYSLLNTNIDIKGKAYEEIVGANLRGDRGEFFTPRNVMKMVVAMIDPELDEKVLDSSCGTGGFPVIAMTHVMNKLEKVFVDEFDSQRADWNEDVRRQFQEQVSDLARSNFFAFDLNPDLVKAAKMNIVMNNDGSGNIWQANSLLPPHEWSDEFKRGLAERFNFAPERIRNANSIGLFDVIVTNPPFGSKIPIDDEHILKQFELAHIWTFDEDNDIWRMTNRLQSSVSPEILFVERCTQFLKPGGRMGIVLPDSILGSPGLGYIRTWLIRNHKILASIDLHADTFQPHNGTQTSVLILQKKTSEEILSEELHGIIDYEIFMAQVERVGHDKRGNTLFKRDDDGREILLDGEKIIDDETAEVAHAYRDWKKKTSVQHSRKILCS